MPTTIAKHDGFDRIRGRWSNFRDVEEAESASTRAALFGVVSLAALLICVACLANGMHPASVDVELAGLLSP